MWSTAYRIASYKSNFIFQIIRRTVCVSIYSLLYGTDCIEQTMSRVIAFPLLSYNTHLYERRVIIASGFQLSMDCQYTRRECCTNSSAVLRAGVERQDTEKLSQDEWVLQLLRCYERVLRQIDRENWCISHCVIDENERRAVNAIIFIWMCSNDTYANEVFSRTRSGGRNLECVCDILKTILWSRTKVWQVYNDISLNNEQRWNLITWYNLKNIYLILRDVLDD